MDGHPSAPLDWGLLIRTDVAIYPKTRILPSRVIDYGQADQSLPLPRDYRIAKYTQPGNLDFHRITGNHIQGRIVGSHPDDVSRH